jgi:hypothetical protein
MIRPSPFFSGHKKGRGFESRPGIVYHATANRKAYIPSRSIETAQKFNGEL